MSSQEPFPVPGWYPDPTATGQLRYWDGHAWTEQVTSLPGADQPPYQPLAPPSAPHGPPGPSGLGEVGSLVSETFSKLFQRGLEVAVLLFLVPWVGLAIALLAARSAVADVRFDTVDDSVEGFDPARLIPTGMILLVVIVATVVCYLAAYDLLDAAHRGRARGPGESLATGVVSLPRAIFWGLLIGIAIWLAFAIMFGLPLVAIFLVDGRFAGLLFLGVLALVPLSIWLYVKLAFFLPAIVVSPRGTNPVSASWRLSNGRFWPVLGRVLLIAALAYGVSLVGQIIFQIVGTALGAVWMPEVDSATGELLLDGQPISDYDEIGLDRFLPSGAALAFLTLVGGMANAASHAVTISGTAALYARADGPSHNATTPDDHSRG